MGRVILPRGVAAGQQVIDVKIICNSKGYMTDIKFNPPMPSDPSLMAAYQKIAAIVATRVKMTLKASLQQERKEPESIKEPEPNLGGELISPSDESNPVSRFLP